MVPTAPQTQGDFKAFAPSAHLIEQSLAGGPGLFGMPFEAVAFGTWSERGGALSRLPGGERQANGPGCPIHRFDPSGPSLARVRT